MKTISTLLFLAMMLFALNSCSPCIKCDYHEYQGVCRSSNDTVFWFFSYMSVYLDSAELYRSRGYQCDSTDRGIIITTMVCDREEKKVATSDLAIECW